MDDSLLFIDDLFDNELRVIDYLTRPIPELTRHKNFNIDDFKRAIAISRLTGKELEKLTNG